MKRILLLFAISCFVCSAVRAEGISAETDDSPESVTEQSQSQQSTDEGERGLLKGRVTETRLRRPAYAKPKVDTARANDPVSRQEPEKTPSGLSFQDFTFSSSYAAPPERNFAKLDATNLQNVCGVYQGALVEGPIFERHATETRFTLEGQTLAGSYRVANPEDSDYEGKLVLMEMTEQTARFRWFDKFGSGQLIVRFAPDYSDFEGLWSSGGTSGGHEWFGKRSK